MPTPRNRFVIFIAQSTEERGQVLSLFVLGLDQAAQFFLGFKVRISIVVCS